VLRQGPRRQTATVPQTYYKARGMGKLPPCAICAGPGTGPRAELHLSHGVRVWLCAAHRSEEFLRRRVGRDLVVSLDAVWRAAGCLTARRRAALAAHLRAVAGSGGARAGGPLPGSYAWPALRAEAERRVRRGEAPAALIRELRTRHRADAAVVPTERTMRRWLHEARWRGAGSDSGGPPFARPPPRG